MAIQKFKIVTQQIDSGVRLDQLIVQYLPALLGTPLSKGKVRKLVMAGAVYLNSKRVRIASKVMIPGAVIEIYADLQKLEQNRFKRDSVFKMQESDVLFEDDYLIAVNKPPGLPSQPTLDEARDNLYSSVKNLRNGKYIGLHHRLDRDTSGVVLFTKREEINGAVGKLFQDHRIQKTYRALAVSRGGLKLTPQWSVENFLAKEPDSLSSPKDRRSRFHSVRSGGDRAETAFKIIQEFRNAVYVEAQPKTGRTHQIRVHLAEQGMPMLGDSLYGRALGAAQIGLPVEVPRLMLHALSLTFLHPIHQNQISILSPVPKDFASCLEVFKKNQ